MVQVLTSPTKISKVRNNHLNTREISLIDGSKSDIKLWKKLDGGECKAMVVELLGEYENMSSKS